MGRTRTRREVLRTVGSTTAGYTLLSRTSPVSAQESEETWSQFGYDTANIGYGPSNTGPVAGIESEWSKDIEGHVFSSPVVTDGTVYVGSHSVPATDGNPTSYVYALDANGGTEQWTFETNRGIASTPAVSEGTVYIHLGDVNVVYALDADDGTEQWRFRMGDSSSIATFVSGTPSASKYVDSSPVVTDGTLYVGSIDTNVYALDASTGAERWRFKTDEFINSSPAVVDGTVYIGSHDSRVYALDSSDGAKQWSFGTSGPVDSSPAVADDTVYVGSRDENVYALSVEDGTQQWSFSTGGYVISSPAVADGTVFVGSWDDTVYALGADDGTEQWTFRMGEGERNGKVVSSPAVVDDTVYIGYDDGSGIRAFSEDRVYALDASDGSERWQFQLSNGVAVWSSPAVVDGTVYVGSWPGEVYALTGQTPREVEMQNLILIMLAGIGFSGTGAWWLWKRRTGQRDDEPLGGDLTGVEEATDTQRDVQSGGSDARGAVGSTKNDSSPTRPAATSGTRESAHSTSNTTSDHSPPAEIRALLKEGDDHRAEAEAAREEERFEQALRAYEAAREAYENARESASKEENTETKEIDRKLTDVGQTIDRTRRQQLQHELASARSKLDRAVTLADVGMTSDAREVLTALESRLVTLAESAAEHELDELQRELASLDRQREYRLDELSANSNQRQVPSEIPQAPDVTVEYDTLMDETYIGSGGNADVVRATLPTPEGEVVLAIKRPRISGTLHTERAERLLEEAETWERLDDHDHIVGIVDWGTEPLPWIAMEYMDGGHLGSRAGEMPIAQALWTAIAVTKGVRHAHRRGVAHLDLKPENILFRTVDNMWDVPKVADWGLSKHLLDHSKSIEGISPHYAAPEQFDDEFGPVDDITDVYQLGAVFYELFTGRPPFEGRPTKVMRAVMDDQLIRPSEIANVPKALDEILLTALAKERTERYEASVYLRDVLQDLYEET